jgi:hypothetical protein
MGVSRGLIKIKLHSYSKDFKKINMGERKLFARLREKEKEWGHVQFHTYTLGSLENTVNKKMGDRTSWSPLLAPHWAYHFGKISKSTYAK